MTNKPDEPIGPQEALKTYRRISPDFIVEQAGVFIQMPIAEQMELLFYMCIYQANTLSQVAKESGMEITEIQPTRDN